MQKKEKAQKKKPHVPFRLNLLFLFVFVMFTLLILRLGTAQLIYGEDYKQEVERTAEGITSVPVPRGKIYDRSGLDIVDNQPLQAITYTRFKGSTAKGRYEVAKQLAQLIDVPTDKITERDKKDFWIFLHEDEAKEKLTKEDKALADQKKITNAELDDRLRSRITAQEINSFTQLDLKTLYIKSKMDSGFQDAPQIIKSEGVTNEEYAVVSEHLMQLPGVDTTVDWDRTYPFGDTFRSVLGSVTNSNEGLPKEKLDFYLAREYDRNDRVGKSYIEQVYEDLLHGKRAVIKNTKDKDGNILGTQYVSKGERGKDLYLTIDINLQKSIDQIIEDELKKARQSGENLVDRAFVVMTNPQNGEVLAMSGKQIVNDNGTEKVQDFALGTMTSSYPMGSVVKGATVLTGFQQGAIKPGEVLRDEEIYIKGTPRKKSYKVFGPISDEQALQVSSNAYMFKTALRLAGYEYTPYMSLDIPQSVFDKMRRSFSEFGLGVPTGIDLPNEAPGFKGLADRPGFLLDLAIGQYDTYTPLQLAQYVSTIANGGYRLKPQILKAVYAPKTKADDPTQMISATTPAVLNRIDMSTDYINRVKQGFQAVMQPGGTGYFHFAQELPGYALAGKTGTAQTFYDGPNDALRKSGPGGTSPACVNLTLIGYAPADNPEVAFSVVVPWVKDDANHPISKLIGKRVVEAYFQQKTAEAAQQPPADDQSQQQPAADGQAQPQTPAQAPAAQQ
ncbi:peptidoglycan D,D-transpeptidase FtsI family protein [Ectobacillus ponti]|uniref:serine-type D-Ala-D-Ala carboxypeptidase n=1 Tax=Ectobacillus ponti TaxID=2961894 RepID=A0AA41X6Q7_9BACI|nr:penicillin-binding protein 2 [Ectobacillus ponti]MCP8967639.1 penicillin-binding protein 2 [Ectobacillus ponti]